MAVAVAALVIWQVNLRPATAEEGGGAAPWDAATYRGVSELRSRVRLSDATLAAMGCSQTTVETVLGRFRTWWQANRVAWVARRRAVAKARMILRRAERRARTGPRDPELLAKLPSLRKAVADARKAEAQRVATAVTAVEGLLSASQRGVWATVRGNPLGGQYACAADLSAAQVKAIGAAQRTLGSGDTILNS